MANPRKHRLFVEDILTVGFVDKGDDPDATITFFKKAEIEKRIEHRGEKYVVLSEDGSKVLGTHDTLADARSQLSAIESGKKGDGRATKLMKFLAQLGARVGMPRSEVDKLLAEGADDGSSDGDGAGNGGDMAFDKSKLDAAAKGAYEKLEADLATVTGERDDLKKTAGDDKDTDDVLKGASPEIQEMVKAVKAEAAAATASAEATAQKVEKLEDAKENSRFLAIVEKGMRSLPEAPADDLAPILRKCAKALDEDEYKRLEKILTTASTQIQEGLLLKRMGSGGVQSTSVDAEIQEKVDELRKVHPTMKDQQLRGKVFKSDPDLRRRQEAEITALRGEG